MPPAVIEEITNDDTFEKRLDNIFGNILFEDRGDCDVFLK